MTPHSDHTDLPAWLTLLFATACGLIVANIYYAQPLIGAIAAPLTGRIADKGWSRPATIFAMLAVACAFLLTGLIDLGSSYSLAWLVVSAIVLDFGVSANLALGQRAIFLLPAENRSRLNGVFMATFF